MKHCCFCGDEFNAERPYAHCMKQECGDAWRAERRADMTIVLLPKQGFTLAYKADTVATKATVRH